MHCANRAWIPYRELFQIRSHNGNDTPGAVMNMKNLHKLPHAHQNPIYTEALVCAVLTRERNAVTSFCAVEIMLSLSQPHGERIVYLSLLLRVH